MARIMVVEDDARMRRLIAEVPRIDGYEPVAAEEGVAALSIAVQGRIDAAVIDVVPPGMDGFELCRHLRRYEVGTGVLLLTARSGLHDLVAEHWGSTEGSAPAVVDQDVSSVRKQLAASGADVTISTVRGVGYRPEPTG